MKVGDRVKLTEVGAEYHGGYSTVNPRVTGTVMDMEYPDVNNVDVEWDNGELNCYTEDQLEVVSE